ncbi:FAD-binding protein [Chloroflexota bacterium]
MNLKQALVIEADVLVVGSGAAGLRAAIAARENGSDVLLISRSRTGLGNNTAIAGRGVAAPNTRVNPDDSIEVYFKDTIIGGRFLNDQTLVDIMTRSAAEEVMNLERFGVRFQKKDGDFVLDPVPGFSYPRTHMPEGSTLGTSFSIPLTQFAEKIGVRLMPGVFICRLIKKDDHFAGAIGMDKSGQIYYLKAKAMVLATGGLGQIYLRTDNAKDTNGDGYSLAYNLGIPLVDMEFIQYIPTSWGDFGGSRIIAYEPFVLVGGAKFLNAHNEDILERHEISDPMLMTRSAVSRAMMLEIMEGRGIEGSVIMDLTVVPEQVYSEIVATLPSHVIPKGMVRQLVSPTVHFCCGGVKVDVDCQTAVPGLFGAGEVCGGLQGANRVAGNAFTACYVMGAIAGSNASTYARNMLSRILSSSEFDEELSQLQAVVPTGGNQDVARLHQQLKDTMWHNVGVIRTQSKLRQGLQDIELLKERMARAALASPADLIEFLSMTNMLVISDMIIKSALIRTESRGNHYRADFPSEDNNGWLRNITVWKGDQEMEHRIELASTAKMTT